MHKFIDNIVAFSLKNKFFIFFCTAIAVIAGAVSFKHTPIENGYSFHHSFRAFCHQCNV